MRLPLILLSAALAAPLALAGPAAARPAIDSVEIDRVSAKRAEVVVEFARGTSAKAPRVSVRVGRRTIRLAVRNWDSSLAADDLVAASRTIRVRSRVGRALRVRVRACDTTGCVATRHRVTVFPSGSARGTSSLDDATPLPDGAIDAYGALQAASALEPDATLVRLEREDDYGAVWKVRLLRPDRTRVKVYLDADGQVLRLRTEGVAGRGGRLLPPPAGAVTPEQALTAALDHLGGGDVYELSRSRRPGAIWKVEVLGADALQYVVFVAADGSIVASGVDEDERDDGLIPVPDGAIGAQQAAAIAVAHVGGGSVREIERTSRLGALWKVEVVTADRVRSEVYVGADGTVLGVYEKARPSGSREPAVPAGAIGPQAAADAALAYLGGAGIVREVEPTRDHGAVWEVKVVTPDRIEHEVFVDGDGAVVHAQRDD